MPIPLLDLLLEAMAPGETGISDIPGDVKSRKAMFDKIDKTKKAAKRVSKSRFGKIANSLVEKDIISREVNAGKAADVTEMFDDLAKSAKDIGANKRLKDLTGSIGKAEKNIGNSAEEAATKAFNDFAKYKNSRNIGDAKEFVEVIETAGGKAKNMNKGTRDLIDALAEVDFAKSKPAKNTVIPEIPAAARTLAKDYGVSDLAKEIDLGIPDEVTKVSKGEVLDTIGDMAKRVKMPSGKWGALIKGLGIIGAGAGAVSLLPSKKKAPVKEAKPVFKNEAPVSKPKKAKAVKIAPEKRLLILKQLEELSRKIDTI